MNRVVITGLGVICSNAHGVEEYNKALKEGKSGVTYLPHMEEMGFAGHVGAMPQNLEALSKEYFSEADLLAMSEPMILAGIAGQDCYEDAGLEVPTDNDGADWDTGAIMGTGSSGLETACMKLIPRVEKKKIKRLGSTMVEQTMCSSVSAKLGGILGLGGQVTTNSSACTTGTEAIVDAFYKVKYGMSPRMIAGGVEGASVYVWAGFDAMKVTCRKYNHSPEQASRPMSASAAGFVPGSGAAALMLETLESAQARGAKIYGEILGGHVNCGGQRSGGTMQFPNPKGTRKCISEAIKSAGISPDDIDAINGHLTATMADPYEVAAWQDVLNRKPENFPYINSTKSLIGHGLGAAGALEVAACTLQLKDGYVHPSVNCEDLHPELSLIKDKIPQQKIDMPLNIIAKASFGFGDVNGCLILKKWNA